MYVLVKCGVYRHELWGCYNKLEEAKKQAENRLRAEQDDYHSCDIIMIEEDSELEERVVCEVKRTDKTVNYKGNDGWFKKKILSTEITFKDTANG